MPNQTDLIYIYIYIYMMGLTNSTSLNDLIKCIRPLRGDTDKHKRVINKSIQIPWIVTKQLADRWSLITTHIHEP